MIDDRYEKDDKLKINSNKINKSIPCNLNISNKNDNRESNDKGNEELIIFTDTNNNINNSDISRITAK